MRGCREEREDAGRRFRQAGKDFLTMATIPWVLGAGRGQTKLLRILTEEKKTSKLRKNK
jgi:hypothetical protein